MFKEVIDIMGFALVLRYVVELFWFQYVSRNKSERLATEGALPKLPYVHVHYMVLGIG